MSQYLNRVMAAIRRMDLRKPPETTDVEIAKPMLVDLATKLNKDDPIRFAQVGWKFVVDATQFRALIGFGYLQEMLKKAGEFVTCTKLSPICKQVVFEPVAEQSVIRSYINRKKALIGQIKGMRGNWSEDYYRDDEAEHRLAEELLKIETFLSRSTFNCRPKHIHNDFDRNRQTVCKNVRLAISYLEDHPDTAHIGQHLRENIKLGADCRYIGGWMWIFN